MYWVGVSGMEVARDTSQAAHAQHVKTPHIKAWQTIMDPLLAKPYDVTFWEPMMDSTVTQID